MAQFLSAVNFDLTAYPRAVGSEADGIDVARQRHGGDLVAHEQLHTQSRV